MPTSRSSSRLSLQFRLLLTVLAGLVMVVAVHLVLMAWLTHTTQQDERNRLDTLATALTGVLAPDGHGGVRLAGAPPDPALLNPQGVVWALIYLDGRLAWLSPSAQMRPAVPMPFVGPDGPRATARGKGPAPGAFAFATRTQTPHVYLTQVRFDQIGRLLPVDALPPVPSNETVFTLVVAEDSSASLTRLDAFRLALILSVLLATAAILLAQLIAVRWVMRPLRTLSHDLMELKTGHTTALSQQYPRELLGVTSGLNEVLAHESQRLDAHRNALDNLAHALKTPLAVLRTQAETAPQVSAADVLQQVERMHRQVTYQLSAASRAGRAWSAAQTLLEPLALDLAQGLDKLHRAKGIFCEFDLFPGLQVPMGEGDTAELLGNLLDNAFKWGKQQVRLSAGVSPDGKETWLAVADDGPGVPADRVDDVRRRGHRADERVDGHGIGLASVEGILALHHGHLTIDRDPEWGGARFTVRWPRPSGAP